MSYRMPEVPEWDVLAKIHVRQQRIRELETLRTTLMKNEVEAAKDRLYLYENTGKLLDEGHITFHKLREI